MSLTMRVRPNKYHDLKPSDQQHTSGQRRSTRGLWTDIGDVLRSLPPEDLPVSVKELFVGGPDLAMNVSRSKAAAS